ncbi:MAG: DCC1-like thiol-disulfide oxidoreductase family protein [Actinomycetota bacterium]
MSQGELRRQRKLRCFASRDEDGHGAVLIFDGDCGFCTTAAGWATRGFRRGERAVAGQVLEGAFLDQHRLSLEDLGRYVWWVDESGVRESGHRAIGRALRAAGGLRMILGYLSTIPPTSWLAAIVYRLVARWRYRLPGGTPACKR